MKNYSVFDVIGPRMIGPSSSHTAGAARIALAARKVAHEKIKSVKFYLHGSFAQTYKGHGTDKALVGGFMGFATDDERIRNSFEIARENGLEFEFIPTNLGEERHPNTVKVVMTKYDGTTLEVIGESIGGGNIKIVGINGLDLEFTGAFSTLIVKQWDKPGAAAHITNCVAKNDINIAFMRIYREEKGENAFTIIEADNDIPDEVVNDIKLDTSIIQDAFIIRL
ncbi:MAG: L-serine ammonia-lyase, iron-sulfur-dependent, subunit beta [Peptoclostridium sp.]|uniref:L-serine ammonia-lyase, iron-sulfur-dependent subunit beta n=1 Tax=Peptoclostridium sp. TaxID=1904860 RepID=UPI00139CE4C4|nr:L-serine ammonia-lyase, iron-sulfur-dependent subunit beta [Peptoclostridium sp.]MZQ76004.1 L-serine ammonia-lyase, iron-sulfur-dependent, subunit beta [Peptoclostridium sp.]